MDWSWSHIKLYRRIGTSIFVKEKCLKASIGRISNWRGIKTMVLRKKALKKAEKRKLYHTFHWGFRLLFRRVRRNCRSEGFFLYCQLCLSSLILFPESSCRPLLQRCLHLLPGKGKKIDGLKPRVTNDHVLWCSKLHWFWKDCFHWLIIGRMFRKLSRWRIILRFEENDVGWRDIKMTRPGICQYQ